MEAMRQGKLRGCRGSALQRHLGSEDGVHGVIPDQDARLTLAEWAGPGNGRLPMGDGDEEEELADPSQNRDEGMGTWGEFQFPYKGGGVLWSGRHPCEMQISTGCCATVLERG